MPPSLILEVLRITEGEMDLRDLTRAAEEARPLSSTAAYEESARALATEQADLFDRTEAVVDAILDLPQAERDFARELRNLRNAAAAMEDAWNYLDTPTTGAVTVAAETEAIEHLLAARRGGQGGGGGGGGSPGGGGSNDTARLSALALVGRSLDGQAEVEAREMRSTTGRSGDEPPAELRAPLDRYFERLNAK